MSMFFCKKRKEKGFPATNDKNLKTLPCPACVLVVLFLVTTEIYVGHTLLQTSFPEKWTNIWALNQCKKSMSAHILWTRISIWHSIPNWTKHWRWVVNLSELNCSVPATHQRERARAVISLAWPYTARKPSEPTTFSPNHSPSTCYPKLLPLGSFWWLMAIFDGAVRRTYKHCLDYVSFNATYLINMYKLCCTPFIGINNLSPSSLDADSSEMKTKRATHG